MVTAAAWIRDGDKYAFVGLSLKVDNIVPVGPIGRSLWLYTAPSFDLPDHWSEWLGSIRSSELEGCNVFLLSKAPSSALNLLDDENQRLQHRASTFYWGLLLASRFAPAHKPVLLTGSRRGDTIDIRQQQDFETPLPCTFRFYPEVLPGDFSLAARLAEAIVDIPAAAIPGGHWRLFRALYVYMVARTERDALERLHQYCRCIEGLIGADPGRSKSQFRSRTELFIGPHHHDLMGGIYDLRSDVEHLHEDRHLLNADRAKLLDLVQKEAVIENLARRVLATVLGNGHLWAHFANRDAIAQFWKLRPADREALWGLRVDINEPLASFDPTYINDGQLGLI
jgi:hypothetical protein